LKRCYLDKTNVYAWKALSNVKEEYVVDLEQLLIIAQSKLHFLNFESISCLVALDTSAWNKALIGLKSEKFKILHPVDAIKCGLVLLKKIADLFLVAHISG
jgi:hypothetical protein